MVLDELRGASSIIEFKFEKFIHAHKMFAFVIKGDMKCTVEIMIQARLTSIRRFSG